MPATKHATRARQYATQVVNGRKLACSYVRAACQRHLDDLDRAENDADYEYQFSEHLANRACKFIELLPHVKGRWAGRKELIKLQPWQCFIVCSLFGWVHRETGMRRFREAYLEIPRKNGKSVLAAAIGLYMFVLDGEFGAEVYSGATSEKQAWEVFRPARLMAMRADEFASTFGVEVNAKNLAIISDGSRFEPLIGDPGDGASPSCAIVDEYHEHKKPNLYETMVSGMGAREQPLALVITTAGDNTGGPCFEKRDEAGKVLEKTFDDETFFAMIFTVDADYAEKHWNTVRALKMANPNYGVSVSSDYLKRESAKATRTPSKQNTFKTKHLNVWVGAAAAWVNMHQWRKAADRSLSREQFSGDFCFGGLDLASKLDLAASVQLFPRDLDGVRHWYCFGDYYLPDATIYDRENPMSRRYQGWVEAGHLTKTDGEETDYDVIESDISELGGLVQFEEIAYDQWRATHLAQHLEKEGAQMVQVAGTAAALNEAMREIEAALAAGRFHHDGNPVLSWMASNLTAREYKGALTPQKPKYSPEKKIDGMVALIMAMSRALFSESSYYEGGGFISV